MRMIGSILALAAASLGVASCGANADDGKEATSISMDMTDGDGAPVKASSDGKTGAVAIDIPGFKASIAMPKISLGADSFDLNGVNLYPGSTVRNLKIDNVLRAAGAKDGGETVRVIFHAPAKPDVVKDWFLEKLNGKGDYKVTASADGISGADEEGAPFAMKLRAAADGNTDGVIVLSVK